MKMVPDKNEDFNAQAGILGLGLLFLFYNYMELNFSFSWSLIRFFPEPFIIGPSLLVILVGTYIFFRAPSILGIIAIAVNLNTLIYGIKIIPMLKASFLLLH